MRTPLSEELVRSHQAEHGRTPRPGPWPGTPGQRSPRGRPPDALPGEDGSRSAAVPTGQPRSESLASSARACSATCGLHSTS
jgi:hypothetical protein